ncbi:MAG TPA: hypothetical protein VN253_13140, partial [Kofleriaceae bacterium]|nr:hypothetical protein [Kofleriaceae bacterium]
MRKSLFAGILLAASLIGAPACVNGVDEQSSDEDATVATPSGDSVTEATLTDDTNPGIIASEDGDGVVDGLAYGNKGGGGGRCGGGWGGWGGCGGGWGGGGWGGGWGNCGGGRSGCGGGW